MNWLLIIVVLVLAFSTVNGYRKGFLRMLYSAVAWLVVFAFVSWATPYIDTYLRENTSTYQTIVTYCEQGIREKVQEQTEKQLQQELSGENNTSGQNETIAENQGGQETAGEQKSDNPGTTEGENAYNQENTGMQSSGNQEDTDNQENTIGGLSGLGINLPQDVLTDISQRTAHAADSILDSSGTYSMIAEEIADFILKGISFFLAMAIAMIAMHLVSRIFRIVSRIPILRGVNRYLGMVIGALYGIVIVWIAFYLIAICSSSEIGAALISYIYESKFLAYLYENNLIITLVLLFF